MARWDSCNILQTGAGVNRVWQFNKSFALSREQTLKSGEPLPAFTVKSWSMLWQKKLNVAWLPPENVFIRAAQFPPSSPEETRTMVELQLEKLSPIPVTQAVWTMHLLPAPAGGLQTVIVIFVERSAVEEFLGRLEGQGFMADRLELPMLDQLEATQIDGDGAWIYPDAQGKNSALVAWWCGGALQSLGLVNLPPDVNRAETLKDQLIHMAWAGELEGWLASPPRWHLVADAATAGDWETAMRTGLNEPVKVLPPLAGPELAARTAKRAATNADSLNLLPPEFAKRYRQQFVDRLWMRGLGTVLGIYLVGCLIYFVAVQVLTYRTNNVEDTERNLAFAYTNSLQIKAKYDVLKDREALKFAALNSWEAVAEKMPTGLTLDSMNFNDGKRLLLSGSAPSSQMNDVIDFSGKAKKYTNADNQPLFTPFGDQLQTSVDPRTATVRWSFGLELKKGEED